MFAKIVNEQTKQCDVALGKMHPDDFVEMDVKKAYDGNWYVAEYVPEKPQPSKEEILAEKRKIRNQYLQDSDKYVLPDFPIESSELKLAKEYRIYLRDFFNDELKALTLPVLTFEEYKQQK